MSCARPESPASAAQLEILRDHRPWLQYSQDPFRICSVRTIVETAGNALHRPVGAELRAGAGLSLEALSPDASADEYLAEDRDSYSETRPPKLQDEPSYSPRVYGRVVEDGRGGHWLQYWFWLYYNHKRLLGFGAHEGDWEMIQIHVGRNGRPTRVTFAQHDAGEAKRWGRGTCLDESDGHERIVVFVAPFSHASYYSPGTHFYAGGTDSPDELGPRLLPEVEPFGSWANWPGRWGATAGRGGRRESPASPGCQGTKWNDPARFHRFSSSLKLWQKALRAVWIAGHLTYPRQPAIEARIVGDRVRGRVAKSGLFRRGRHLYLTAHAIEDRRLVGGPVVALNVGAAHPLEVELRERVDRCLVHATAYNVFRQTSDPGTCEAARSDEPG